MLYSVAYLTLSSLAGLGLLGYATARFPASQGADGFTQALVAGALLAYLVAARCAAHASSEHRRSTEVRRALQTGAASGVAIAAAAVVGHSLEVFAPLHPPIPAVLGVGMWGLMFLLLGGAAAQTYRRRKSVVLGVLSSTWAASISSVTTVVYAFVVGLMFMSRMEQVLSGAFAVSGMTDGRAFVVRNMIDGAFSHLLIAPAVAVLAGAASLVAYTLFKSISRVAAGTLAGCALVVAAAGIAFLRFASSLERSARPVFVMVGLLLLGLGLTSLSALFAVIRRAAGAHQHTSP